MSEKKRRIRIQFDLDYPATAGKEMDEKSLTVPDMNLTVRQLLENHVRGVDGKVKVSEPLYFETEIPTIKDMTDIDRYKEALQARLAEVDEFIKNEQSEFEAAQSSPAEGEEKEA